MRWVAPCVLLAVFVPIRAADDEKLPPDISPDDRAAWVKEWRADYLKYREQFQKKIAEGKQLAKFATTAADGRKLIAEGEIGLDRLDKQPTYYCGRVKSIINAVEGGDILSVNAGEYIASAAEKGVLVSGVIVNGGEKRLLKLLVASPMKLPKGKKESPIALPGLWYVAGSIEIKGESVPVLYRFEVKKDDFPK